ncbi:hypothetical protein MRX96_047619 [Rhipicephalus microplus]
MGSGDIQCPLDVSDVPRKYAHIFRKKKTWELVMLSGAVCGIELCYAAETAFIGPILLGLGIPISFVALAHVPESCSGLLRHACAGIHERHLHDLGIALGDSAVDMPDDAIPEGDSTNALNSTAENMAYHSWSNHRWGIMFTIVGFVFPGHVLRRLPVASQELRPRRHDRV